MDIGAILSPHLARWRAEGFTAFRGAAVDIRVPISDSVANEALRAAPPPGGRVRDVAVAFGAGNRLRVRLSAVVFGFVKSIELEFEVARAVDFAEDPRLRLRQVSGGVGSLLAGVASLLGALPEGVTFVQGIASIDLRRVLVRAGLGEIVPLVRAITIDSEPGVFVLGIELRAV